MKYFKFTKIDNVTGISINAGRSLNGQRFPDVQGLQIIAQDAIITEYWYGTAPNTTKSNPENHFFELSYEELVEALQASMIRKKQETIEALLYNEYNLREDLLSVYHPTTYVGGLYRLEQAKDLIEDENAPSPDIRLEANIRGMNPVEVAQRLVVLFEKSKMLDSVILGFRGKLLDRINNFELDEEDVIESWKEFESYEVVGKDEQDEDIKVKKYSSDLAGYVYNFLRQNNFV